MDVWRVSINHCQFGPTPSCTPIISSQYSEAAAALLYIHSVSHSSWKAVSLIWVINYARIAWFAKKQGHLFSIFAVNIFILKTDGMFHSWGFRTEWYSQVGLLGEIEFYSWNCHNLCTRKWICTALTCSSNLIRETKCVFNPTFIFKTLTCLYRVVLWHFRFMHLTK